MSLVYFAAAHFIQRRLQLIDSVAQLFVQTIAFTYLCMLIKCKSGLISSAPWIERGMAETTDFLTSLWSIVSISKI